ncbi:MAG: YjiH family protein [Acidobacteriota bacterium]
MSSTELETPTASSAWLRFLLPSAFGAGLLLIPFPLGGKISIALGHAVDAAKASLGPTLQISVTVVIVLSAALALLLRLPPLSSWRALDGVLGPILRPGALVTAMRCAGAVIAALVLLQRGPSWLVGPATGGVIFGDLLPLVFLILFAAAFIVPCLTDYGLMEFAGGLLSPIFRPIFGLPGRSAIDALASWLGAASVGVLITANQYEQGAYTRREAMVIAGSFSVVSVPFAYVIVDFVGLGEQFIPYYLTVIVCGLVAALLCPFLPPLRSKADDYLDGRLRELPPRRSGGRGERVASPLAEALAKASKSPSLSSLLRRAGLQVLDIWLGLLPMVALIGTGAIAVAETTPLFRWLGLPFVPILQLLGLPEAGAAAPAMVVGFADQFLPAVLGRSIESEATRFVVACTAVNQLIYLSEVGVILLRSALPFRMLDLVGVFLVRTVITLPIAAAGAHLVF